MHSKGMLSWTLHPLETFGTASYPIPDTQHALWCMQDFGPHMCWETRIVLDLNEKKMSCLACSIHPRSLGLPLTFHPHCHRGTQGWDGQQPVSAQHAGSSGHPGMSACALPQGFPEKPMRGRAANGSKEEIMEEFHLRLALPALPGRLAFPNPCLTSPVLFSLLLEAPWSPPFGFTG